MFFIKGIFAALLLVISFSNACAAPVRFDLYGTVTSILDDDPLHPHPENPFGLIAGDLIKVTATFDGDLIDEEGFSALSFDDNNPDSIDIFITVGNAVYTSDDYDLNAGVPTLWFNDGYFSRLDYSSSDKQFDSYIDGFYGSDFSGEWDYAELTSVPVPAAAWLFGSGLIGLIGVARRKVNV